MNSRELHPQVPQSPGQDLHLKKIVHHIRLPAAVVYLLWKPLPNPTNALILHRNGRLLSICTNVMPSNSYTGTSENIFPHITVLSSLWTRLFRPLSTCTTMGNEESIFCCMWVCFSTHAHIYADLMICQNLP
jgi:hypothetical protein